MITPPTIIDEHRQSYEEATKRFPDTYQAILSTCPDFYLVEEDPTEWMMTRAFLKLCRHRMTKHSRLHINDVTQAIESPEEGLETKYIHFALVVLAGLDLGFSFRHDPTKVIIGNSLNIRRSVFDSSVKVWAVTLRNRDKAIENGWKGAKEAWGPSC